MHIVKEYEIAGRSANCIALITDFFHDFSMKSMATSPSANTLFAIRFYGAS